MAKTKWLSFNFISSSQDCSWWKKQTSQRLRLSESEKNVFFDSSFEISLKQWLGSGLDGPPGPCSPSSLWFTHIDNWGRGCHANLFLRFWKFCPSTVAPETPGLEDDILGRPPDRCELLVLGSGKLCLSTVPMSFVISFLSLETVKSWNQWVGFLLGQMIGWSTLMKANDSDSMKRSFLLLRKFPRCYSLGVP